MWTTTDAGAWVSYKLTYEPSVKVELKIKESQKSTDRKVYHAIEVKCPCTGKVYTTSVYYKMPWYYVTKVLSEMYALKSDNLILLCYSEEKFDSFHWQV